MLCYSKFLGHSTTLYMVAEIWNLRTSSSPRGLFAVMVVGVEQPNVAVRS